MRKQWMALSLVFGLTGAGAAWAEGQSSTSPDKDKSVEDILQQPAEETFGSPSHERTKASEEAEPGTVEDTLQQPAEETMHDAQEAVIPSSGQVAGTVKSVDTQTGYFSVDTAEGSMQLHADPKMLTEKGVKEGDQIQASVEKKGEMNHVTSLMKEKSGEKAKGAY